MLSQGLSSSKKSSTPLTLAATAVKTHLPSVLSPTGKIPEMSYPDAISWLHEHNANSAATLSVPFPLPDREVDICIYDPIGMCLKVWNSGEMILTDATSLQNLITELQSLIDRCCLELKMSEKYLILDIEMRVLNNGDVVGFPKLVGEPKWIGDERDGKKGAVVQGVVWKCDGGDMEVYWDASRRMMQIGDAEQGIKKPMLKLRTFRQKDVEIEVGDGGEEMGDEIGGYYFVTEITGSVNEARGDDLEVTTKANRLENGKEKVSEGQIDVETTTNNMEAATNKAMAAAAQEKLKKTGNPLGITGSELEFAFKLINEIKKDDEKSGKGEGSTNDVKSDVFKIYSKHLGSGGKPLKELAWKKGSGKGKEKDKKSASTDPKRNWGYYQRMGGDPKMHDAFPLDAVPFEESDFKKWVGPEDPDYPDDGNDQETVKSLADETAIDTSIKMVPYMTPSQMAKAAELAERKKIKPSFPEAAIGFDEEDDAIFCPKVDQPPSPVIDPKKAAAIKALRGAAPQHKKVETLRAIGLDKILGPPVVPQSSLNNSAYLNALGSSGVAPPAGAYNNFSSTTTNQGSGFQARNTYTHNANQSPVTQWTSMSSPMNTPTLGFYDTMTPAAGQGNTGMNSSMGGMTSNLSHIARTSSRMGFPSSTGTPLRADSPAFQSTSSANKPTYAPPAYGPQGQQQQQGGGFGRGGGASGSASGGQQFDYNSNIDALNAAAKKWFLD